MYHLKQYNENLVLIKFFLYKYNNIHDFCISKKIKEILVTKPFLFSLATK